MHSDHGHQPTHAHAGAAAHAHALHETAPMHDPVDEWHDHSRDEIPQSSHTDVIDARAVIGIGIVLFLLIAFSVLIVWWFYTGYAANKLSAQEVVELGDKHSPAMQARAFRDESSMQMLSYRWITVPPPDDKTPGQLLVQLPISEAMKRAQSAFFAKPATRAASATNQPATPAQAAAPAEGSATPATNQPSPSNDP